MIKSRLVIISALLLLNVIPGAAEVAKTRNHTQTYTTAQRRPLYMPTVRDQDGVTTAGDSIAEYAEACARRDAGDADEWERRLAQIAAYNQYDCVSTLRLRDWLLARAAEQGVTPRASVALPAADVAADAPESDPLIEALLSFADRALGAQPVAGAHRA